MRTDETVANSDRMLAALMQKGPEVAHVAVMLRTVCWNNWRFILLNQLRANDPANPTSAEWAEFRAYVFSAVKQRGIEKPDDWLAQRAQRDAKAALSAPAKVGPPVEIGNVAAERKSAEHEPVALENRPTMTSAALPPRPAARTVAYGTTKAEVLSRAKAAVEAGESLRAIAERLACAKEDFHASQREISRAIGPSATWVNRLLKWRQSGYKQTSPFGPTTRAGRASHRKDNNGSGGGAEQPDDDDNGNVSLVGHCSPPYQSALLPAPVNENLPSRSTQTELLPSTEAAKREIKEPKTETAPLGAMGHKRSRSDGSQIKKQRQISEARRKLSPERMRIVIDSLRESPSYPTQLRKQAFTPKHSRIG